MFTPKTLKIFELESPEKFLTQKDLNFFDFESEKLSTQKVRKIFDLKTRKNFRLKMFEKFSTQKVRNIFDSKSSKDFQTKVWKIFGLKSPKIFDPINPENVHPKKTLKIDDNTFK